MYAKGLCAKHYQEARSRKLGAKPSTFHGLTVLERLKQSSKLGPGGCILFTGSLQPFGHGKFTVTYPDCKITTAHRASFREAFGPIPNGLCVLHKCDVPNCINPEHLFLGTLKDNNLDMVAKNRHAKPKRGLANPNGKLSDTQVSAIRVSVAPKKELAALYNVSTSHIYNIQSGFKRAK